jgi:hypothetical protein
MRARFVLISVFALAGSAAADKRGTIRVGMLPLDLEASADTPLFGSQVQEAVDDFNAAAMAHGASVRADTSDVGIAATLYSIAPGIEIGDRYVFRLEGVLGRAGDLTSYGVGVYPLGLQGKVARRVSLSANAGGTASWLDRDGEGDIGALVVARLAVGARIADRFLVELGYNAFVLGGTVNKTKLDDMRNGEQAPELDSAIAAGEARGLVDVSVGLSF